MRTSVLILFLFDFFIAVNAKTTTQMRYFFGPRGSFGSPAFPDLYPNECRDTAVIQLGSTYSDDYRIHLDFLVVQLENRYDTVDVFDGNTTDPAASIARLTGNMTGRSYESDGPTMTILFQTDLTGQRDGFYVRWFAVRKGDTYNESRTCENLQIDETTGYGLLYSPGYIGNYPDSITCPWELEGGSDQKVILIFYAFETEDCYDTVTFYDGAPISANQRSKKMCGNVVNPNTECTYVLSEGRKFSMVFSSDLTKNFAGFSVVYRFVSASDALSGQYIHRQEWTRSAVHPKPVDEQSEQPANATAIE